MARVGRGGEAVKLSRGTWTAIAVGVAVVAVIVVILASSGGGGGGTGGY